MSTTCCRLSRGTPTTRLRRSDVATARGRASERRESRRMRTTRSRCRGRGRRPRRVDAATHVPCRPERCATCAARRGSFLGLAGWHVSTVRRGCTCFHAGVARGRWSCVYFLRFAVDPTMARRRRAQLARATCDGSTRHNFTHTHLKSQPHSQPNSNSHPQPHSHSQPHSNSHSHSVTYTHNHSHTRSLKHSQSKRHAQALRRVQRRVVKRVVKWNEGRKGWASWEFLLDGRGPSLPLPNDDGLGTDGRVLGCGWIPRMRTWLRTMHAFEIG